MNNFSNIVTDLQSERSDAIKELENLKKQLPYLEWKVNTLSQILPILIGEGTVGNGVLEKTKKIGKNGLIDETSEPEKELTQEDLILIIAEYLSEHEGKVHISDIYEYLTHLDIVEPLYQNSTQLKSFGGKLGHMDKYGLFESIGNGWWIISEKKNETLSNKILIDKPHVATTEHQYSPEQPAPAGLKHITAPMSEVPHNEWRNPKRVEKHERKVLIKKHHKSNNRI